MEWLHTKLGYQTDSYNVKLLFAEKYFNASGSRIFDVYLEQNRVIENLDIYHNCWERCRIS